MLGGESTGKLELPCCETPLPTSSNKPNWALDSPQPLDENSLSLPKQIFSNFKLKAAGALNGGGDGSFAAFKGGVLATVSPRPCSQSCDLLTSLTELPMNWFFTLSLAVYAVRNKIKPTINSLVKLIKMVISQAVKLGAGEMNFWHGSVSVQSLSQ